MKIRGTLLLALIVIICFAVIGLLAETTAEDFLAAPDYKTTEGILLVQDNRWPVGNSQRILWARGDYIVEILVSSGSNLTTTASAEGYYRGTNWSVRGGTITLQGELSEDAKQLQLGMEGLSPDEFLLSTILGRGFTINDLKKMKAVGSNSISGTISGRNNQATPILVELHEIANEEFEASIALKTKNYRHLYSLRRFSNDSYVPLYVKKYVSKKEGDLVLLDVTVNSATNVEPESLSPWVRYHISEIREREKERLYVQTTNNVKRPILNSSEIVTANKSALVRVARVVLACSLLIPACFFLFRMWSNKNKNKK
jgi:hypothetical protein